MNTKRFLAVSLVLVLLCAGDVFAGKRQGGGGGGGGGKQAAKAARKAGGGGGRGINAGGMRQGNGGGRNAFRSGGGGGRAKNLHQGGGSQSRQHARQGKAFNSGQGRAAHDGVNAGRGAGLKRGNAAGIRRQALHSHAGAHHARGFARANRVHVQRYSVVVRNYHGVRHDRFWWRTHYSRIVVVGGGWYYWDAGYWYPAWGYDPAFASYAYDGPIYAYDNLPPDQVIVNVQTELQFQGYYNGTIDGQLGPETRAALADYQRDHDLEITQVADEPTVDALGLT